MDTPMTPLMAPASMLNFCNTTRAGCTIMHCFRLCESDTKVRLGRRGPGRYETAIPPRWNNFRGRRKPSFAGFDLSSLSSIDSGRRCAAMRSEEHTYELQSRGHLVCRLLL